MDEITEFEYLDPERVDAVGMPANGTPWLLVKSLDGEGDADDGVVKFVSAAARRKYAASGVAMSDGAFPIQDEGHLRSAIGRLGNYKGNKQKAKRHIIRRAKALGLTHLLPHDWHVGKKGDTDAEKAMTDTQDSVQGRAKGADVGDSLGQTKANGDDEIVHEDVQNDAGKPQAKPYRQPKPATDNGYGDTAPDKSLPEHEALSQTREEHAEKNSIGPNGATSEGTVAPNRKRTTAQAEREAQTQTMEVHEGESEVDPDADQMRLEATQSQKGKRRIEMDNPDLKEGGAADNEPHSAEWEHKDAALAEAARQLLTQATAFVQEFEAREKSEVGGKGKKRAKKELATIRRAAEHLSGLADGSTTGPAIKELENMTQEELMKLLDKRDRQKEAKMEKAAIKAAKKDAKRTAKAAKVAKAGAATGEVDPEELAKRVLALENAPVRRAAMNNHADLGARPVLRGETAAPDGLDVLQKAVATASTPAARAALEREFIKAKYLANSEVQVPTDDRGNALPHGPVALISQPPEAYANARAAMGRR